LYQIYITNDEENNIDHDLIDGTILENINKNYNGAGVIVKKTIL